MTDWQWFITCYKSKYVELLIKFLPRDMSTCRELRVYVGDDAEPGTMGRIVTAAMDRPDWKISVAHAPKVEQWMPDPLKEYFDWHGGAAQKVVMPLLADGPMLFTDDDMVLLRDPSPLLSNTAWGSKSWLDRIAVPSAAQTVLAAYENYPGPVNMDRWLARTTDAGVYWLPDRLDPLAYQQALVMFFSSDYAYSAVEHERIRGKKGKAWKLDQRFLTAWLYHNGGPNLGPPHYRCMMGQVQKSLPRKATFMHYLAQGKDRIVEWLESLPPA
jgi:hypothetical protein